MGFGRNTFEPQKSALSSSFFFLKWSERRPKAWSHNTGTCQCDVWSCLSAWVDLESAKKLASLQAWGCISLEGWLKGEVDGPFLWWPRWKEIQTKRCWVLSAHLHPLLVMSPTLLMLTLAGIRACFLPLSNMDWWPMDVQDSFRPPAPNRTPALSPSVIGCTAQGELVSLLCAI